METRLTSQKHLQCVGLAGGEAPKSIETRKQTIDREHNSNPLQRHVYGFKVQCKLLGMLTNLQCV